MPKASGWIFFRPTYHAEIAFSGCYERELTRHVRTFGEGGGVLVDVGANVGYFSLIGRRKPHQQSDRFEAAPGLACCCEKRRAERAHGRSLFSRRARVPLHHDFDQGLTRLRLGGLSLASEGHSIESRCAVDDVFARHNDDL